MRNLKRTLSLALAALMLMGMMVVSAGAATKDFTDSSEIQNKEAVEVMVALNVISGKDDGSYFAPNDTLTREEMAKVVSYVMNGGVEPVVGTKVNPTYSDIKGIWSEKYIEYCTSMGIINGDGAGKFNPTGTLTAEQAAKMFLTAMGYNANVFGFTGNDWAINVGRYANEAGLYKNLGHVVPSQPISRDDACQMAYNAIQATMMKRTWTQDLQTGELTESYQPWVEAGVSHTLLGEKFNGSIKYAYISDFTYDEVKGVWQYNFLTSAAFSGNAIDANKALVPTSLKSTQDFTSLFGRQVKVIYKTTTNDVIYGIYASDSSVIASGASGEIGTIDDSARTVKVGGTAYKLNGNANTIRVYDMGITTQAFDDTNNNGIKDGTETDLFLANLKATQLNSAFTFELIDNNGDNKIDAVIRVPVTVSQIIYVGTDTISFSNLTQKDKEHVVIYDNYAKGDWVYYTAAANAPTGRDTFTKAELKTATVDGVKGSAVATGYSDFQLGGEWYSETTNGNYSVATAEVNDSIEYVTLGSVIFYAKVVDVAATTKNVAMVISAESTTATGTSAAVVKAKLLFADGTKTVVNVAKLDGTTATYGDDAVGDVENSIGYLVTYRVNSDGDYELTSVATSGTSGNLAGYKGAANGGYGVSGNKQIGGYELADEAVVFVLTSGTRGSGNAAGTNDGKVYTGKEMKNAYASTTFGTTGQVLYGMKDGFYYGMVAGITGGGVPNITTGSNYGYLTSGAFRTVESDKTYLNVTFWTQNGEVPAKFESLDAPAAYPAGAIITYDTVSEGVIKNVSIVNAATGVVTGWDGVKKIQIDNSLTSEVDSVDTVVIYVNSKDKKGAETSSIQLGKDTDNDDMADVANIRYVNGGAYLSLLVVDVNNEMQPAPAFAFNGSQANDAGVTTALTSSNSVTVNGTLTSDGLRMANGKSLTVTGALTATGDITYALDSDTNVSLIVDSFSNGATSAAFVKTRSVQITGTINDATLKALADNFAFLRTITLKNATSDVVSTATNFFATNGTAVTGAAVPAGTYTYYAANTIIKNDGTNSNNLAGWYTTAAVNAVKTAP